MPWPNLANFSSSRESLSTRLTPCSTIIPIKDIIDTSMIWKLTDKFHFFKRTPDGSIAPTASADNFLAFYS